MGGEFAHAVDRARVQACGAVRLGLQPDTHVLDRAGENGVSYAGECAGHIVLRVGEVGEEAALGVVVFQAPAGFVEGAELDGDLG